jgi:hypothetical protein
MLIVQTDKDPGSAGWLADPDGAAGKEALTTDNVAVDSPTLPDFPYVGEPN